MSEFIYYAKIQSEKKGPFTIEEIKELRLSPKTLVWKSDSPDWLTASAFSELENSLIQEPPLLPEEKKKILSLDKFENTKRTLFKYFLITSFTIGIISSIIAIASYNNWPGKGHESEFGPNTWLGYTLRYTDPSIGWHPYRNNESVYAEEQLFLLRPLYPFFSTAYLSLAEQENNILVFGKQLISSFLLFAGIFLLILLVLYFQEKKD